MKATFVKDENESIWFSYATDIWARENETAKMAMEFQLQQMKQAKERAEDLGEYNMLTKLDGVGDHDPERVKALEGELYKNFDNLK